MERIFIDTRMKEPFMKITPYVQALDTVRLDANVCDVLDSFHAHKESSFVPVVNTFGEPVGIVREQTLRQFVYTRFGQELLVRRKISEFLSPCPVVSHDTNFEDLIQTPTFQERKEGFIIVRECKYFGFLSVSTLLEMYEDHRLNTQQQLLQAQKMESIGTLAGGIAHDFNNILGSISGHATLIRMKLRISADNPVDKYLVNIETLVQRAADLTGQLLGFARGGKYEVHPLDANEVIRHVISILRQTFDSSIGFEQNLCSSLCSMDGDKAQLEQVLMNLFINARDSMPDGGVITVTTKNVSASSEVAATQLGNFLDGGISITVRDTGMGIPLENQKRVFEPFFSTKEKGKGTGMGLAMVYGIVRNHGGRIELKSEVGKGTAFTIYLPRGENGSKRVEEADQGGQTPKKVKSASILVVDDDPNLLPVISEYLEHEGCKVFASADGRQAIRHYSEHYRSIDLVLLDMIMPVMSGQQIYQELLLTNPQMRAIFMSGYSSNGTMQQLLSHERTHFLKKPFSFDQLMENISRVLGAP
jgi:signal transduction histidine kinase/CheY-like chemotaxis protein